MSMHDNGYGRKADPSHELQSDFSNSERQDGSSWGVGAPQQQSEGHYMAQGAGRPAQPIFGQNSIFGGGGPGFTQMPTYTPVTRGPVPPAQTPQPHPSQPQTQTQPLPSYPTFTPQPPVPTAAPQPRQPIPQGPTPHHPSHQPSAAPSYQLADLQPPQAYRPAPQTYPAPGYPPMPETAYQPQNFPRASPSFPDRIFPDPSQPNAGMQDASFPEPSLTDPGFAPQNYADVSFPEPSFDASFPEQGYVPAPSFAPDAQSGHDPRGYEPQAPGFEPYPEPTPDYGRGAHDQVPPSDPRRQLAAFEAIYDHPPQINLGATEVPRPAPAPQNFYETERADADFMDEGHVPAVVAGSKFSKFAFMKGKSAFMVGSALLGAIALGVVLAFAYKQSGGSIGETPVVQADSRPVKEMPADAGGKEFPHKNKLIYDRLSNENQAETENLVPRQEDVAVPALPPSTATGGLTAPVANTDFMTPPTTQAVAAVPNAVPMEETGADGGPRKVKTMVVRPDGSVMPPPADAAPAEAAGQPPAAPADMTTAAGAAPAAMPVPNAAIPADAAAAAPAAPAPATPEAAAPQQVAAAAPAAAPAKYAVQLSARKSQTEALAAFADIQQKHPTLLANYRPMVSKDTLGTQGTLYKLRIGPIDGKTAADKLCGELKGQGTDCFVVAQ